MRVVMGAGYGARHQRRGWTGHMQRSRVSRRVSGRCVPANQRGRVRRLPALDVANGADRGTMTLRPPILDTVLPFAGGRGSVGMGGFAVPELDKPCIIMATDEHARYPRLMRQGRRMAASRHVLEQKLGRPIADNMIARHLCFQKRCIEPSHIVESTHSENRLDADVSTTGSLEAYPCGHPRTRENGRWHKDENRVGGGRWECRACGLARSAAVKDAAYWREYRRKRREQGRPVGRA